MMPRGYVVSILPPPSPIPPQGGRFMRICSPKVGLPVSGIVFSSRPVGYYTHFFGGRTHPCLGSCVACVGCADRVPKRWKAYLFGRSDQLAMPCLFELPRESVVNTLALRDPGVSLRGALIKLVRIGPNQNSPVRVELRLDARPEVCPADEPDVQRHLCRIWGVQDPRDAILQTEGGHDA